MTILIDKSKLDSINIADLVDEIEDMLPNKSGIQRAVSKSKPEWVFAKLNNMTLTKEFIKENNKTFYTNGKIISFRTMKITDSKINQHFQGKNYSVNLIVKDMLVSVCFVEVEEI